MPTIERNDRFFVYSLRMTNGKVASEFNKHLNGLRCLLIFTYLLLFFGFSFDEKIYYRNNYTQNETNNCEFKGYTFFWREATKTRYSSWMRRTLARLEKK